MNVKMEPKLEVSLVRPDQVSGGKKIGEVLSKPHGDLSPVWDHTLPPEDFEIGEQLHLKVLDKHHWPKGDVLVGQGSLTLSQELVNGRQPVEMRLAVHKISTKAGTEPEHTGDIQIQLQLQGEKTEPARGPAQLSDKPVGRADPRRFEMNDGPAMPTLPSAATSFPAPASSGPPPLLQRPATPSIDGVPKKPEIVQSDRDWALHRAGLDGRQEISKEDLRPKLVDIQYWERGVRSRNNPILCTAGIRRWLKAFCCRAGCCRGEAAYDGFKIPGPDTEPVLQDKEIRAVKRG